jgi:Xaa-Pro aminopeptidase
MQDFFGGLAPRTENGSVYQLRRKELIELVKAQFPHVTNGAVILFAAIENENSRFRQDKTFFYYTGINEPGTVLVIDMSGTSTLYLPNCFDQRTRWMSLPAALVNHDAKAIGFDAIALLGEVCAGYQLNPYFSSHEYAHMITYIEKIIAQDGKLFTTAPHNGHEYVQSRFILDHVQTFIPNILTVITDISPIIAQSRRRKDVGEIENVYRAIEITELAHESAVQTIKNGMLESEVQAALEYVMTASHARPAFPSIVASGKNGTVLHYLENNGTMKNGDLVVIDIGAEFNNYCADLTRTYPVSGTFTKRQRELYSIVLETQEHIAGLAKPGLWLRNNKKPDQSLHHLAVQFLAKRGYDKYFPHGIGHFLGLDVHDVGDYGIALQEGDVITIEPGIYISEEGIGIRIEDDYWITKDGVICLSEHLPKDIDDIEGVMQRALSGITDDENEFSEDDDDDDYEDEEDDDMYH